LEGREWDPEKLVALYKDAGAKFFVALANHHDNFDNYDSKYQPWNSVALGPQKDLIGGWARRRATTACLSASPFTPPVPGAFTNRRKAPTKRDPSPAFL